MSIDFFVFLVHFAEKIAFSRKMIALSRARSR